VIFSPPVQRRVFIAALLAAVAARVRHQMQFLRGFSVEMPMKSTTWLRAEKLT
jgi:hypothetical protein